MEMRARITVGALAASLLGVAAATASGATSAGAGDGPATTGRALIGVRTPALPTGDGREAALKRDSRLDRSRDLLIRVAQRNGIDVDARSDAAGLLATELDGSSVAALRARLASDPLVESVRLEGRASFRYTPNEPFFGASDVHAPGGDAFQWPLLHQSFPKAWDVSKGLGAEVAVIDSGADRGHPDLASRVTASLNCAGLICLGSDVTDTLGHGTHVSGLACADSDNGFGVASAGFDCSLYVIKTDLSYASIIDSIYAAANHGSDAINMSFGGGAPDSDLRDAIDYAWGRGAIPVAAADNEPNPPVSYPAQYIQAEGTGPNIDAGTGVVVTSVSHTGLRSAFAQSTAGVSLAAVGSASDLKSCQQFQQGILSTWPASPTEIDTQCQAGVAPVPARTSLGGDNRFAYLVGTSMASPQVAGLIALMRAANQAISAPKAVRLLKLTASNCGEYAGGIGWGTIRADQALAATLSKDADPPSSQVRRASVVPRGNGGGASAAARKRGGRGGNVKLRLKRSDPACSKELPSSGVKKVAVFASANGGRYRKIAKTKKEKVFFRGKPRRRYRFYSIAVDKAGNREAPPDQADAKLRFKKKRR
jgi:hypothetical protein